MMVMMHKKAWRLLSITLSLTMIASLFAGCAKETGSNTKVTIEPMEVEEVYSQSYDIIGGKDVMPIAGYHGPYSASISYNGQQPVEYVSDEIFQALADCGVNLLTSSPDNYDRVPQSVIKQLELGEKYGIGLFVTDESLTATDKLGDNVASIEEISQRLMQYSNYPAFAGLYLVDEPTSKDYLADVYGEERSLDKYAPLTKIVADELQVNTYANLLKVTGSGIKANYEKYIKEFCDTMNPDFICFDYYIFDESCVGTESLYLWNIAIVREYAQEYGIPFWNFIQAGGQWNDAISRFDSGELYPNEGEVDWAVNVNLAFGAKGICWFPLLQPLYFANAETEPFDFERNGLLGAWGNKTQWYYYAQAIHKHIDVIDEVLMNSTNKGILATGEQSKKDAVDTRDALLKGDSWRELKSVDGDALIGCFNYQGKTALYVVNYSQDYAQDITLHFQDSYKVKVVQKAETSYVEGNSMTLQMTAGDGALLVFE